MLAIPVPSSGLRSQLSIASWLSSIQSFPLVKEKEKSDFSSTYTKIVSPLLLTAFTQALPGLRVLLFSTRKPSITPGSVSVSICLLRSASRLSQFPLISEALSILF
nr:MAG TPA: hypothetical protein [Bacteriophage sp.]